MSDESRKIRVCKLDEQGHEHDIEGTTPAERIGMMWQLALDAGCHWLRQCVLTCANRNNHGPHVNEPEELRKTLKW